MPRFQVALFWSFFATGGRRVVTALLTFALAAILGPEAYGVVAMASAFVQMILMFLEQGLGTALIQREDLRPEHKNVAFWLTLGLSAVLALLCFGLAGPWSRVNDLPDLEPVIQVLALLIPLEGLSVVQQALLQRDMDFKRLALRANLSVLTGGAAGLVLALQGFGVWALVAQNLLTAAASATLLWAVSDWRPELRFDRRSASELIRFSLGALLGRMAIFVNNRSDALLMGIFFGPVAVGLYRLADRLMGLFVDLSSRSIQAVAFPEFSRFQSDPPRLARSALRCLRTSASLAIPPLAVMAAGSTQIVALIGESWADAAFPLTLLCGVGAVRALALITGPVMRALGRPYAHAVFMWCHALPSALAFWAVAVWLQDAPIPEQAAGIALSRTLLFGLVFLPVNLLVLLRLVEVRLWDVLAAVSRAGVAGAVGAIAVFGVAAAARWAPGPAIVGQVASLVVGGGAGMLVLLALEPALQQMLRNRLRGRRGRPEPAGDPPGSVPSTGGSE